MKRKKLDLTQWIAQGNSVIQVSSAIAHPHKPERMIDPESRLKRVVMTEGGRR